MSSNEPTAMNKMKAMFQQAKQEKMEMIGVTRVSMAQKVKEEKAEMMKKANASLQKAKQNVGVVEGSLKSVVQSSIQSSVKATNNALESMEESSSQFTEPVVSAMGKANSQRKQFMRARDFYTQQQYSPFLVGGATLVGGLVGLRRGKIPAVATSSAFGFVSYLGVYEVEFANLPNHVFGKQER